MITIFSHIFMNLALLGIFSVILGYPFLVWIAAALTRPRKTLMGQHVPGVTLIVVVHNGADLVIPKVQNTLALDYPEPQLETIFFSDGSNDRTMELLSSQGYPNLRILASEAHEGKFNGLNRAAMAAAGEILVFSDVDALLEPQALVKLTRHFRDQAVGGVCGRRLVGEGRKPLSGAQALYTKLDGHLKALETRIGSITSNDGKLFAIRKSLFRSVPPGVTDDLYTALGVVAGGKRFLYDPEAVARVKLPSRNTRHELTRRRRIVSQSLNSMRHHGSILNPKTYGLYSIRLIINKGLRRTLPLFLLALFPTSLVLYGSGWVYGMIFWLQLLGYLTAGLFPFLPAKKRNTQAAKISATAWYFCIGMVGTLLGVVDFIYKTPPAKWKPFKHDGKDPTPS